MNTARSVIVGLAVAAAGVTAAVPAQAAPAAGAAPPGCTVWLNPSYSATGWCNADAQRRSWRLVVLCERHVSYGPTIFWIGYSSSGCFPEHVTDAFIQYL